MVLLAPAPSTAATDTLTIRGFGNWAYGVTDGNHYINGSDDGDYNHGDAAISFIASPAANTTIFIQTAIEIEEETTTKLDFGFAEYAFSNAFKFRGGFVQQPFGIYTDIFSVGTLRPFSSLPQGIYGEGAGIVAESLAGAGLRGDFFSEGGWGVSYDLYFGSIDLTSGHPWEALHEEEEEEGAAHDEEEEDAHSHATLESHVLTDMFGGRLVVETPVEGLSVGASAYTGDVSHDEHDDHEASAGGSSVTYGLQAEYDNGTFVLRTEYVRQDVENEMEVDAAYVEASYMIYRGLQAAVRYDWSDTSLDEGDVDEAPSVLEHEDWGIGLNYWFNPNFVVKCSYHIVTGNRFAESEGEGGLEDETTLFSTGVALSF
jgi:hypothetical protein